MSVTLICVLCVIYLYHADSIYAEKNVLTAGAPHGTPMSEKLQASWDLYEQGLTVASNRILETPAVYSKFLFVYINWYM